MPKPKKGQKPKPRLRKPKPALDGVAASLDQVREELRGFLARKIKARAVAAIEALGEVLAQGDPIKCQRMPGIRTALEMAHIIGPQATAVAKVQAAAKTKDAKLEVSVSFAKVTEPSEDDDDDGSEGGA